MLGNSAAMLPHFVSPLCLMRLRWLTGLVIAMLMLAGTIAEAATCGPEPVSGSTADAVSHADTLHAAQAQADLVQADHDTAPSSDKEPGQHQACPHGHCHHGAQAIRATAPVAMVLDRAMRVEHAPQECARTAHAFGLIRPPRA